MFKFAKIINPETGLYQVGFGYNTKFYQSIGMNKQDVKQSDIDGCWYKEETAENIIKIKISWGVEYLFNTILSFTKCTLQSVLVKIFLIVAASSSFLSNLSFFSHRMIATKEEKEAITLTPVQKKLNKTKNWKCRLFKCLKA